MSVSIKAARMGSQGGLAGPVQAGGLFSFLKGAGSRVAGAGIALATGGGVLGAARAITRSSPPRPKAGAAIMPLPRSRPGLGIVAPGQTAPVGVPLPGASAAVARILPGGATGVGTGCPAGFHPNKTAYHTLSGYVPKGSKCVRNRRRNPLNPRALDRSMGRIASAGKALKRLGFKAPSTKAIAQRGKAKRKR